MTDSEEFEKWWLTKFSAEFLDSDNCWSAWTGWQARGELDAVKIKELEAELAGWKEVGLGHDENSRQAIKQLAELTAKLDKAREALKEIVRVPYTSIKWGTVSARAGEALKELDK